MLIFISIQNVLLQIKFILKKKHFIVLKKLRKLKNKFQNVYLFNQ